MILDILGRHHWDGPGASKSIQEHDNEFIPGEHPSK